MVDLTGESKRMHRTMLLGIDGATFSILDDLMAHGRMPHLASVVRDGVRGVLTSTPHPLTPPAWTTVMTGRMPGQHGIFDFIWAERRGDQVYFTLNNFRDIQVETIWSMVSRQGGRATTLNFPLMAPPPAIHGLVVPGLVSWKHLRRNIHPPRLYDELKTLPGFDPREVAWDFEREKKATKIVPEDAREEWVTFHIRREQHWFDIFGHVCEHHACDLTSILIDGVDKLQHICWRYLDPALADSVQTARDRHIRDLCLRYFDGLDAFIGRVVEAAEPDGRVFIVSDHGFGPTEKVFRVNKWLEREGYLAWAPQEHLDVSERAKIDRLVNEHFVHLDWDRTVAYAQSAATNGIHIRVQESPGGPGIPAASYASFCRSLAERLLAERDPDTGKPVVVDVLFREEAFSGDHNTRAPDLTLVLHDYGFISTLDKEPIHWGRPEVAGTHHPDGVFYAIGEGISGGVTLARQSIVDVAPTVLHSLGLAIPSDLDGGVIETAFEPGWLAANPVRTGGHTVPVDARPSGRRTTADDEEDTIILERLRALGYVE